MPRGLMISIVIPVYNEEEMIGPCLDAILAQSVVVDEIIVVDNGSTDATVRCLQKYEGMIRLLHERRRGVQYARSTGMDAATGDIIGRIDADTRLPVQWTEKVRAVFADEAIEAVTGPARYYDIALPRAVAILDLLLRSWWAWPTSQRLDWIFGANMAIRAATWRAVSPALCDDRDIHEDVDLGIHLHHGGHNIVYRSDLAAITSSRRLRDTYSDFRSYLLMTERGYSTHARLARRRSYRRAWATTRIFLLLYRPLRLLHTAYHRKHETRSDRGTNQAQSPRKNPMSH